MSERPPARTAAAAPGRVSARRRRALRGAGVLTAAALLLAGCVVEDPDAAQPTDSGPLPADSPEGFAPVPLYFVALQGEFPPETSGREVACNDLLVGTDSVPVNTEQPAATAIDFLLADEQYSHGDPAVTNSLDPSEDELVLDEVRVDGDLVTVELSGELVSRSLCESYRIRAQLHRTATRAVDVDNARILVNGQPIEDLLGLEPFELGPVVTTPPEDESGQPGQSEDATPGVPDGFDEWAEPTEFGGPTVPTPAPEPTQPAEAPELSPAP